MFGKAPEEVDEAAVQKEKEEADRL
jgi:hypothetical protein